MHKYPFPFTLVIPLVFVASLTGCFQPDQVAAPEKTGTEQEFEASTEGGELIGTSGTPLAATPLGKTASGQWKYEVYVVTGTLEGSSTDAKVTLTMLQGQTADNFVLDDPAKNDHQAGQTDYYVFYSSREYDQAWIDLNHDNSKGSGWLIPGPFNTRIRVYENPDWYVSVIQINRTSPAGVKSYHEYRFDKWLKSVNGSNPGAPGFRTSDSYQRFGYVNYTTPLESATIPLVLPTVVNGIRVLIGTYRSFDYHFKHVNYPNGIQIKIGERVVATTSSAYEPFAFTTAEASPTIQATADYTVGYNQHFIYWFYNCPSDNNFDGCSWDWRFGNSTGGKASTEPVVVGGQDTDLGRMRDRSSGLPFF